MPELVTCVRCLKSLPKPRADIVGNGYRCEQCTAHVQHEGGEEEDVADNVPPEERERAAKQGKRRFFASMGAAGALVSAPAAIGFVAAGPVGALVGGFLGAYLGATTMSAVGETSYAQWKRYRQPPLPRAKLRK